MVCVPASSYTRDDRYAAYHIIWPGPDVMQPTWWRGIAAAAVLFAAAAMATVRVLAGLHSWAQVAAGAAFGTVGAALWIAFASPSLAQYAASAMSVHGVDQVAACVATTVLAGICMASLLPWAAITRPRTQSSATSNQI